jgi:hypothetical protein
MATASWAASLLYKLTKDPKYAQHAVDFMEEVLLAQRKTPLADADGLKGFFYRDKQQKRRRTCKPPVARAGVCTSISRPCRRTAWPSTAKGHGVNLCSPMEIT